ncbi:hypothetical protein CJJ19_02765 [Candidatus Williamhamiltonella defendens]|nr:hypothetical protein CJJ19_02765 [Candidatus Hamiltonella defensa]
MIKINAEDHTPYNQNEDPNIKITSKRTPQFTFDEIDDVVNKVTVSVSKSKDKNADPKTIKYTKIPKENGRMMRMNRGITRIKSQFYFKKTVNII